MVLDHNNMMEWAEKYIARKLSPQELIALNEQLRADKKLNAAWTEAVSLMRQLQDGAGLMQAKRQSKNALQQWKKEQRELAFHPSQPTVLMRLWRKYGRVSTVAATVAIAASTITYFAATNTNEIRNKNEFISLKRDVEHIKSSQRAIKESMDEAEKEINNITGNVVGTGFAITNDGYLATDYHVVENADSIFIQTQSGDYYKVKLVSYDATNDIALLQVQDEDFKFSNEPIPYNIASADARLAQSIYSIGFPQDDALYSEGYISSQKGLSGDVNSYQLDLPANPGQSGSPVFDKAGNVIGMIIGKKTFSTYATKSKVLLDLIQELPETEKLQINKENRMKQYNRQDQVREVLRYVCAVRVYKN